MNCKSIQPCFQHLQLSYESNLSADASIFFLNLLSKVTTSVSLSKHTVLQNIKPWLFISVAAENTKTELGYFDLYLLLSSQSNPSKLVRGKIAKSSFYFSFLLQMICWRVVGFLFFCIFPKCLLERKLSWNKNWHSMAKRKLITGKSHFSLAQLFKFSKRKISFVVSNMPYLS